MCDVPGGKTIEEESRKLVSKYGPLSDGEVVVTGAGQLPCSYVLHAVGPMWKDGQKGKSTHCVLGHCVLFP